LLLSSLYKYLLAITQNLLLADSEFSLEDLVDHE